MDKTITDIKAREIFDSRGNPTIEITMTSDPYTASCAVPSGASTGSYEALELRDGNAGYYSGKGVLQAIHHIDTIISPALRGAKLGNQSQIDQVLQELDSTQNKSHLGANALLAVSMVYAKLSAASMEIELHEYIRQLLDLERSTTYTPHIFANIINGGAHAPHSTTIQEFHIVPMHETISEKLSAIHMFQNHLKDHLIEHGSCALGIGDEGGYVISNKSSTEVLDMLHNIKAGMRIGGQIAFALDIAANEFLHDSYYHIDGQHLKPSLYEDMIQDMIKSYHIFAVEDPFAEHEFAAFARLQAKDRDTIVVGDDLVATNANRLQKAIESKSVGGVIIKPNQIGTLSETLTVIRIAKQNNIKCIASHRSGETNDTFIVDLAWGAQCFGMKLGALQRGERVAKYNRLRAISEQQS